MNLPFTYCYLNHPEFILTYDMRYRSMFFWSFLPNQGGFYNIMFLSNFMVPVVLQSNQDLGTEGGSLQLVHSLTLGIVSSSLGLRRRFNTTELLCSFPCAMIVIVFSHSESPGFLKHNRIFSFMQSSDKYQVNSELFQLLYYGEQV